MIDTFEVAVANRRMLLLDALDEAVRSVQSIDGLRLFVEHHVWCVWDFLVLLKRLQHDVAPSGVWPCVPGLYSAASRRAVNELVLAEESDVAPGGGHASHFETYLRAMYELGAGAPSVESAVRTTWPYLDAPRVARTFTERNVGIATNAPTHVVAATLVYGRESIIPAMFERLLSSTFILTTPAAATLRWYLERHVDLDGEHAAVGERLVRDVCFDDERMLDEARRAALLALERRTVFWSGLAGELDGR